VTGGARAISSSQSVSEVQGVHITGRDARALGTVSESGNDYCPGASLRAVPDGAAGGGQRWRSAGLVGKGAWRGHALVGAFSWTTLQARRCLRPGHEALLPGSCEWSWDTCIGSVLFSSRFLEGRVGPSCEEGSCCIVLDVGAAAAPAR
jgi:hypothetical protein